MKVSTLCSAIHPAGWTEHRVARPLVTFLLLSLMTLSLVVYIIVSQELLVPLPVSVLQHSVIQSDIEYTPTMLPTTKRYSSSSAIDNSTKYKSTEILYVDNKTTPVENKSALFITSVWAPCCGFGNQMFIYAAVLGVARAAGRDPHIFEELGINELFELTHVTISNKTRQDVKNWPWVSDKKYAKFATHLMNLSSIADNRNLTSRNVTVLGMLQSWKYFSAIEDEVRREFTIRKSIRDEVLSALDPIRKELGENGSLIGVHVRRGDFLGPKNVEKGYTVGSRTYFLKAFDWMRETLKHRKLKFLVVSNDRNWCMNNLNGTDVIVMPPATRIFDFALLALSDHVILAGGTFGWWGAWLAGGHVVYYADFPKNGSALAAGLSVEDYYPPHWVGLLD